MWFPLTPETTLSEDSLKYTYLFQDALDTAAGPPAFASSNADYVTGTLVLEKSLSYRWPPIVNSLRACLDFILIQG